jgi:signal transduction histidine kinase
VHQRSIAYRLLTAAIAGIFVVTIVVCGIGLELTRSWYRNVEALLVAAETRAAETRAAELEGELGAWESSELARFAEAVKSRRDESFVLDERHPFELPFIIDANGALRFPRGAGGHAPVAWSELSAAPDSVVTALRLAASKAPIAERCARLAAVARSMDTPLGWRLRARLRQATILSEAEETDAALAVHEGIIDDFSDYFRDGGVPTLAHVLLARLEIVARLGEVDAAKQAVADGLETLVGSRFPRAIAEEKLFVERSAAILGERGATPPDTLLRLREELAAREQQRLETESLRDRILGPSIEASTPPKSGEPRHHTTRTAGPLSSIVWTRLDEGESAKSANSAFAIGFHLDIERVATALTSRVGPGVRIAHRTIQIDDASGGPAPMLLASLPGDLAFVRIAAPLDVWGREVSAARRPFIYAGALLVAMALAVVWGLFVLHRGLRRELHLSRMKTDFVAGVSHELKTPLALIRLYSDTLLLDRLRDPSQGKRYLEIISRESDRLGHLIANMLDFASIEAGRKNYRLEPRDLGPVVAGVVEAFRLQLDEEGFDCVVEIPGELPLVAADDEAVAQAVVNLVQNAIRYSPGVKHIEVRVVPSNDAVRISVRDHGEGIAEAEQERIWEDYYRTGSARARVRGSGLGLSVVRHIVRAHAGTVELVSAPGTGSTFTLVFPIARPAAYGVPDGCQNPDHRR